MRIVFHVSRILLGITFIFSGFVKGIDPWGSAYKFVDYFHAMNLAWMDQLALPLGVLLSFAEFFIGVALLFCIKVRLSSWGAALFMAVFTPLTLWIALKNPVTDCGCFGDAIVISNWGTFYKNLVFSALVIIVLVYRNKYTCTRWTRAGYWAGAVAVLLYFILVVYSYRHEPVFDFRPYKVGVNIQEGMTIPPDAPKAVYENTFHYKNKKTGEVKKFTDKDYPWQDTLNWEFSSMDAVLISKGYEPPIHGFTIETRDGENIYDFFLNDDNFVFMLISHDLDKASLKNQEKINALAGWAKSQHYSFICLTSALFDKSDQFTIDHDVPYEFFNCDEITLKTIIRSNPGLIVLKKGTIIAKYHNNDIPTPEQFSRKFLK